MSGLPGSAGDAVAAAAAPGVSEPAPDAAAVARRRARAAGAVGGWLREQRQARGWNVPETARRLRAAAAAIGDTLPGRATLEAHIRRWERGLVAPSERYKLLYCHALAITAAQYAHPGPLPPPSAPLLAAAAGQPRPAGHGCGPAWPPSALAAGPLRPGSWCPAALAHQIAAAIVAGVACRCGHGHATPVSGPDPGAAVDSAGPGHAVQRLITEAAYKRGADVTAIARVIGMTADEVRGVLRSADSGAST
jgi:transcriptional regulator with XRE-family HTH domain